MTDVQVPGITETQIIYDELSSADDNSCNFWGIKGETFSIDNNTILKIKQTQESESIYSKIVFNSNQYNGMIIQFKLKIIKQKNWLVIGFTNNNNIINQLFCQSINNCDTNKNNNGKNVKNTKHRIGKQTKKKRNNKNVCNSDSIFYAIDAPSGDCFNHTMDEWQEINNNFAFRTNDCIIFELNFILNNIKYYKYDLNENILFNGIIFDKIETNNIDYRLAISCFSESNCVKIEKCSVWSKANKLCF